MAGTGEHLKKMVSSLELEWAMSYARVIVHKLFWATKVYFLSCGVYLAGAATFDV